jgi:2-phosphosulfolactate phosphatase
MLIEAVLYPGQFETLKKRDLSRHVAVVFDVFRATSAELTALVNGAARIQPVVSLDEALEMKRRDPAVLLGGERNGLKPAGFDFGNSPQEYTPERVRGKKICHTTTNGTVALKASEDSSSVYLGTLLNLSAMAVEIIRLGPEKLMLVCSGTFSHFALEDGVAAGALIAKLLAARPRLAPSASACLSTWRSVERNPLQGLRASRNARRLAKLGLGMDVEYCSQIDVFNQLARFGRDGVRLHRSQM